ncbi:Hypothetical predicted protein [Paramuricea clavata]|uniref:Uncharacterized protein n=1 Tax=Paramuricea clavata TaxID=317549 RepID=A0A6S7IXD5_PARCT|nr:Hypothetical predicted protein [Paramuricea clavata]
MNNLGKLLRERLMIRVGGEIVYDNNGESLIEVYKDLWKMDSKRANMVEYGIMNENTRKMLSKDDSADQTAKEDGGYDLVMAKVYKEQKMKLGKILNDHGPYAPYNMKSGFEYTITLPKADKIMVAQASEKVEGYTLKNIHLEYETIENEELAKRVNEGYETGRSLSYEHITLLKTTVWAKSSGAARFNETIDVPRESMRAVVLLFRKRTVTDSEEYVFPAIEKVKVTMDGKPNAVYSQGLTYENFYDEAKRLFGMANNACNDDINVRKFYKDKFALVIDMRAVDDSRTVGSGKRILGDNPGILLEIETDTITEDFLCNIFVLSDGLINISGKTLQGISY